MPIHYESRLAKLALDESQRPGIDPDFEEVTEGEEIERKEKLKTKWAQLEAIVGGKTPEARRRRHRQPLRNPPRGHDGKAMIVCMSRRICIDLYRELVRLRPEWDGEDDDKAASRS